MDGHINSHLVGIIDVGVDACGILFRLVKKGKVFPYSFPSVGPGADPGVKAVSPQVT